jgi:Thioesterase-like superfamily
MTEPAADAAAAPVAEPLSRASSVQDRGEGVFGAEVSGSWTIGGRPNGGYLLAMLGRAAAALVGSGSVVAASAHYLRSPDPGPAEIVGEVLRRGRSLSQVRARLSQGDRTAVEALLTVGLLDPVATPRWDAGLPVAPQVPFEDCVRLPPLAPDGTRVPMLDNVDLRLEPGSSGIISGQPTGRGELRGWIELLGDDGFDPASLLFAVDAFPPALFDTDAGAWISTAEMTAYVRAVPESGRVRVLSRARLIDPQWVDQTCDVWDEGGRFVARAVQLAKVLG